MTTVTRVLIADPPWKFRDRLPGKKRGAVKHYKCMTVSEIMRHPLPPLHVDAVLFLWRVSSMVEEAYQVARAWDFTPKSEIVWNKTTDDTNETDAIGMGHIVRGAHETCIVATRGKALERASKGERTSFRAPVGEHSEKPEEFYRIVERIYPLELWPEAHAEIFARRRRKGWIQFGDELPPANPCLIHPAEPADACHQCSIASISVQLRMLLNGHVGWRGMNWGDVRHSVDQAETQHLASNGVLLP